MSPLFAKNTHEPRAFRSRRISAVVGFTALMLVATACGSSSSEEPDAEGTTDTTVAGEVASTTTTTMAAAEPSTDGGSATLTLSDGTVIELGLSNCLTHDMDAIEVPLIGGFTLEGENADGYEFSLAVLGFTKDEVAVRAGSLETDTGNDDNDILYGVSTGTIEVAVDGGSVTGTFAMRAIMPTRPFGDQVEVSIDASC